MMRTSGPELFFSFNFAPLTITNVPKNIQLNRPLQGIIIQFRGRVVVATAAYTALSVEAPQTILQRLTLRGTHNRFGALTPFDGSGATLFALDRLYGLRGNSVFLTAGAGGPTYTGTQFFAAGQPCRQPDLTKPMGLTPGGGAPAATTFGVIGTFDVEVDWYLPLYPIGIPDAQAIGYVYKPEDWGQTLQLLIQTGDFSSFGTNAGANVTFTAFGSGSGTPQINILLDYVSLGPIRNQLQNAVCIRNVQQPAGVLSSVATQTRFQLLQNYKTSTIGVKTGSLLAGSSAGVSVFATLSDSLTEQTVLRVDNKPLKNFQFNSVTAEFYGQRYNTVQPQGYLGISFVDGGNALGVFPGDGLPGGAQFDVAGNVVTAAGTESMEVIQEMILGEVAPAGS
jgi:hypothetical protein